MQKNWYILYTKPGREKKTAALLTKRKIANFYALNRRETGSARGRKIAYVPLFTSYVFVKTIATELDKLKQIGHVLSLVYWKGQPAIVSEDEINSVKKFSDNHFHIKLIRSKVFENKMVTINNPSYLIEGNVLSVKNKVMKVNLPSLGFTMLAEIDNDRVIGREVGFGEKDLVLQ